MRSAGRRLNGVSVKDGRRGLRTEATPLAVETAGGIEGRTKNAACKSSLNVTRSGAVAFGKDASGQPWQSGACLISVISNAEEIGGRSCVSPLSRPQLETQATNSHKKLIGNTAAINILSRSRIIHLPKIIHTRSGRRHPGFQRQAIELKGRAPNAVMDCARQWLTAFRLERGWRAEVSSQALTAFSAECPKTRAPGKSPGGPFSGKALN
jgi:hypothetical protein